MNLDHTAPGHDDPLASAAGGHAPGKRARTERLTGHRPGSAPTTAGADAGDGAGADADADHDGDRDDPFFFAEGGRAGDGVGNLDPATMQSLYYGINPPRHAEKAYQRGDAAPPLHPRPTTVGRSGAIVALATSIYNRPPFGRVARFSICDRGGRVLHAGAVATPGQQRFDGLAPGTEVLIRPETIGTMVKLLTPEQIAGATTADHDRTEGGAAAS